MELTLFTIIQFILFYHPHRKRLQRQRGGRGKKKIQDIRLRAIPRLLFGTNFDGCLHREKNSIFASCRYSGPGTRSRSYFQRRWRGGGENQEGKKGPNRRQQPPSETIRPPDERVQERQREIIEEGEGEAKKGTVGTTTSAPSSIGDASTHFRKTPGGTVKGEV
ncbi:hypothetical protein CP532_6752 [Ophiocordyceps camponoti-leonardi (nom. inval.)]|nr:hypothetical protein CP532_6752 [Ophiocordyceps camponoti-leonardi (nom. inval.)]